MIRRFDVARTAIMVIASLSAGSLAPLAGQDAGARLTGPVGQTAADTATKPFQALDVFAVQTAADPQISPDGRRVVFVRSGYDIMTDGGTANLWIINADGSGYRALTTGSRSHASPRWSPSGDRVLYVSNQDGGAEIWVRWMDSGQEAKLTDLTGSPGGVTWSPDGRWIAFTMFVPEHRQAIRVNMPEKPKGADWGPPYRVIDYMDFRQNGNPGFVEPGFRQVFIVSADGGAARQVTGGPYNYGAPVWMPDGGSLLVSANRRKDAEHEPMDTEIYRLDVATGALTQLTDRYGPDADPQPSPDGKLIAYTGFDDQHLGYQLSRLYVMNADGSGKRMVSQGWERDISNPVWSSDGRGLFFQYDSEGNGKVAFIDLGGKVTRLLDDVQGLSTSRPYGGGQFSVSRDGHIAYTLGTPEHPADLALADRRGGSMKRLTNLNQNLLGHRVLGEVEEIWYPSSYDQKRIQGWIVKPPHFDPAKKYPLLLEIHGGPFADYGDRFAEELQLYAAAGYVVLYTNPRGSTSYGQDFGNLIHHAYPSHDYDDLMSGVDAVIQRGYIDTDNLFVTGGSGGGVLTAWIVGHTDRFRAAVVQKPVINWYSFVLTADGPAFFYKYWFAGPPWQGDNLKNYMERSPISYVGNVKTPTMVIDGEIDYRTPISEATQFYEALQIRGVPSMFVRIPDAHHGIASKPSNLIGKVEYVLAWFRRYGGESAH